MAMSLVEQNARAIKATSDLSALFTKMSSELMDLLQSCDFDLADPKGMLAAAKSCALEAGWCERRLVRLLQERKDLGE